MLNFFNFGNKTEKDIRKKGKKKQKIIKNETEDFVAQEIAHRLSSSVSTSVKEIMIPRIDMTTTSLNAISSIKELIKIIKESGHSRIPVWKKSVDDIVGILYVKDLLHFIIEEKPNHKLAELLHPPYFIPESTNIFSLLKEFQKKKVHLAVVVDEYGGVSGVVALEDILEEIVGEIRDEFDSEEEELIKQIAKNSYIVDPRTSLEELNTTLNTQIPEDKSDTVGGFIFDLFGRIPYKNESISYKEKNEENKEENKEIIFQILNIEGSRIHKIKINLNEIIDTNTETNPKKETTTESPPPT